MWDPEAEFLQSLVSPETLKSLLFDGWVDPALVKESLNQNPYYATAASLPPWKAAWHGWDLTDAEYEAAVAKVEEQFAKRELLVVGEIFHVFGLRLWFSDVGAISQTRAQVVSEAEAYVNDLKAKGTFPDPFNDDRSNIHMGWGQLGFMQSDTKEFKGMVEYYDRVGGEVVASTLPMKGEELLELMSADSPLYFRKLCLNNVTSSPYYDIPVLASINPDTFAERVLALTPGAQAAVFTAFKGRYDRKQLENELRDEKPWLESVKRALEKKMKSQGKLSQHRIAQRIASTIDVFLGPSAAPKA